MKLTPVDEIVTLSGGRLACGDKETICRGLSFDSRTCEPGDVFVALVAERDGHDFISTALGRGAVACLVSRDDVVDEISEAGAAAVLVDDTLEALHRWAAGYRKLLNPTVIAVTGSNGKTSTKDLIRSVLGERFVVGATRGNFNNHIGLPASILGLSGRESHAVLEIGMNHAGEIAPLAKIAAPDISVVTNIGVAHIEFLGSREAIAEEKGELVTALDGDGVAVINANDDFADTLAFRCDGQVVRAGIDRGDVRAENLKPLGARTEFDLVSPDGERRSVSMPIPGRHMVGNAVLAAAVGFTCGLTMDEVVAGIESVALTSGRLGADDADGVVVIDDSYNANPDSMIAALDVLATWPGAKRRFAALGAMGELGEFSDSGHQSVGAHAASLDLDGLVVVGDGAQKIVEAASGAAFPVEFFPSIDAAADALRAFAYQPGDVVLVKGSRSSRMEALIEPIRA
ncbi:UDP-N-acetylmuramoyl-tripeptide--D-alanyl-D-alanine ligase [Sulfuriroseicoccus oceanibius]|uniref:UDP-N-acetylmuramoyl-tripeptide--D-alanyl-D-alanine ligase n=1 Tax=Sulfuriroseicoccus oceanibius TaxID=2707525 RepID=A0A6B3LBK8_9BACT|nr:UDP-N-acetylmuramoyl-tripeptide--D-alanyl-D-alanine ligase [Sulfuriroseicoccus oceanibius]QQL44702.1 UDP-N-acetylmuramoyl-tripeptide--D-alanyl-D-alanine ligase [Sulfuriroseicoccus oceanibius]